jgi:hypothetical protein
MKQSQELYRAERLPIFQNRMFASQDAAERCVTGDVILVQDTHTGLIRNSSFKPDLMVYDADYQNEQAVSGTFQIHLQGVLDIISRNFRHGTLIEIGCGKGTFLEYLQRMGFAVSGLDPTYEGDNPSISREYFTAQLGIRADGLILRHVLEHVEDPISFLINLRDANTGGGTIYIEVPCVDWIAQNRAWFDIFYEHTNYFRLGDFTRMFGIIHDSGHIFAGQYLYIVADLATIKSPIPDAFEPFTFPSDMLATVDRYAKRLRKQRRAHQLSAIWGGASKGVIFALFMQRAGAPIDFVIDINPAKQRRYLPATGLMVLSPKDALKQLKPGSDIYVMNSNYLGEIRQSTGSRFDLLTIDHSNAVGDGPS